jgi:hypothetical protein
VSPSQRHGNFADAIQWPMCLQLHLGTPAQAPLIDPPRKRIPRNKRNIRNGMRCRPLAFELGTSTGCDQQGQLDRVKLPTAINRMLEFAVFFRKVAPIRPYQTLPNMSEK